MSSLNLANLRKTELALFIVRLVLNEIEFQLGQSEAVNKPILEQEAFPQDRPEKASIEP